MLQIELQHTINAFEDAGHIVLDISCYKSPKMLYCMNVDALQVRTREKGRIEVDKKKKKR